MKVNQKFIKHKLKHLCKFIIEVKQFSTVRHRFYIYADRNVIKIDYVSIQ